MDKETTPNSQEFPTITALHVIERWFKGHCDDLWEHSFGMKLETTDNPGWLATIDVPITKEMSSDLSILLGKIWKAEILADENRTRIFSAKIEQCLCATAYVLFCAGGSNTGIYNLHKFEDR
jgi:hypothetical protein